MYRHIVFLAVVGNMEHRAVIADTGTAIVVVDSRAREIQHESHTKTVGSCGRKHYEMEDSRRTEDRRDLDYTSLRLYLYPLCEIAGCLCLMTVFAEVRDCCRVDEWYLAQTSPGLVVVR